MTSSTNLTCLVTDRCVNCLVTDRSDPTLLHSKGGLYRPDTALVSSDILRLVTREVLEDVGSDHLPALITLGIFSRQCEKDAPTWNFNKADWRAYAHALDTRLGSVDWKALPIEEANEVLVNEIIRAARKTIPRGARKKFTTGWTEELRQAVFKQQAARKDFIRNPRATNHKRYNANSRRAKRIGETTRATERQNVCNGFNFRTCSRTAWGLVRRLEGKRTASGTEPLVVNGRTLLIARAEAEAFTRHYTRV